MSSNEKKICFIITAIGSPDSPQRNQANLIFNSVILPITLKHGYFPLRADHISTPGMISLQIVDFLIESSLVIADLSWHNPNVFYELAIRHVTRKPVIHMINRNFEIPFDLFDFRTILYSFDDEDIEKAKSELDRQISAIDPESPLCENPISIAVEQRRIRLLEYGFTGDIDVIFENSGSSELDLSTIGEIELPSVRMTKKIDAAIHRKNTSGNSVDNMLPYGSFNKIPSAMLDVRALLEKTYGGINFDTMSLEELEKEKAKVGKKYAKNDLYELFEENSHKLNFLIKNKGTKYILDALVKIEFPRINGLLIAEKVYDKPITRTEYLITEWNLPNYSHINYPGVEYAEEKIIITSRIDKIKHQLDNLVFDEPIRIVIADFLKGQKIPIRCRIYGENIPEPIVRDLAINPT